MGIHKLETCATFAPMKPLLSVLSLLALALPAFAKETKKPAPAPPAGGQAFGWPFIEWQKMTPRGGTTQGAEVTLLTTPKEAWTKLHEPGLSKIEQDHRAILALAGNYRVSFDFTESFGMAPDYKPARPYFSWATENVTVLEDRSDFVSLQHTLVMYFKDEKGKSSPPMVQKHWREDWTWQPKVLHIYVKDSSWKTVAVVAPEGRWSQAVYQVDDSPRYELIGAWTHDGGASSWHSDVGARPLPRREFSVRSDYNVLDGFEELILTPTGWVHTQNNRKMLVAKDGTRTCVGGEIGINRYEEITAPDLAGPFKAYWAKTGDYWKDVRTTWDETIKSNVPFSVKEEDGGEKQFAVHFGYAEELEKADKPDPEANLRHARETIARFLVK